MSQLAQYPLLLENQIVNLISVLSNLTSSLVDEIGNAYSVTWRSVLSDDTFTAPEITVAFRPGSMDFGMGENVVDFNDAQNLWVSAIHAPDSTFLLTIIARSDPERWYILDAIVSGVLAAYVVNSNTGQVTESATIKALGSFGIIPKGFGEIEIPDPNLDDPRIQGQIYQLTLPLRCDVWMTWYTDPFSFSHIDVGTTVTITDSNTVPPLNSPEVIQTTVELPEQL